MHLLWIYLKLNVGMEFWLTGADDPVIWTVKISMKICATGNIE
jgi:hypothetical protein